MSFWLDKNVVRNHGSDIQIKLNIFFQTADQIKFGSVSTVHNPAQYSQNICILFKPNFIIMAMYACHSAKFE